MAILPELTLLTGALAFFVLSLYKELDKAQLRNTAVFFGFATFIATLVARNTEATLFFGSYEVDAYSQLFKLMIRADSFINILEVLAEYQGDCKSEADHQFKELGVKIDLVAL